MGWFPVSSIILCFMPLLPDCLPMVRRLVLPTSSGGYGSYVQLSFRTPCMWMPDSWAKP